MTALVVLLASGTALGQQTGPDHAEARYLRRVSRHYLPGNLERGWSVREDFAALGRLLPTVRHRFPRTVYATIGRFELEHGDLAPEVERILPETLLHGDG